MTVASGPGMIGRIGPRPVEGHPHEPTHHYHGLLARGGDDPDGAGGSRRRAGQAQGRPPPDGRIVVPTNQIPQPAGTQVAFAGRPVDLLFIEGERLLVAKNMRDLVFMDPAPGAIQQTLALPAGAKGLARAFSAVG